MKDDSFPPYGVYFETLTPVKGNQDQGDDDRNPAYEGAKPIVTFGSLFGFVPFVGAPKPKTDTAFRESNKTKLILPVCALLVVTIESVLNVYFQLNNSGDKNQDADIVVLVGIILFGKVTTISLVGFACTKVDTISDYFEQWQSSSRLLREGALRVKVTGWFLFGLIVSICVTYEVYISINLALASTTILYNVWYCLRFVASFIENMAIGGWPLLSIVCCRCLSHAFDQVFADLQQLIMVDGEKSTPPTREQIGVIRSAHQRLCELADLTNSLLAPNMTIVIISQSIILCASVFKITAMVMERNGTVFGFVVLTFFLLRFFPVAVFCILAGNLTTKSTTGLQHIYRAPLTHMSPESRFQLCLLESKMTACPVVLTASGFASVNHGLLVQILGMIATYVLVMIQFKKDGDTKKS